MPEFYRDLLNTPNDLNGGHTLHEYWMEDSGGRYGVDLTAFGAYQLPAKSYQYGITNDMNPGTCPTGETCNRNIRTDGLGAWRADVGDEVADSYELVFILSAGQDESSTWQEFGEMRFQTKEDVTGRRSARRSTAAQLRPDPVRGVDVLGVRGDHLAERRWRLVDPGGELRAWACTRTS